MEQVSLALDWSRPLAMGLLVTVALAIVSVAIGTVLGLLAALASDSCGPLPRRIIAGWEAMIRSLPELLIVFAAYYGFAFLLQAILAPFGVSGFVDIGAFTAGVLALSIIHAAFSSEVFRGAFAAVPRGPLEAAKALGLKPWQAFWTVKLPVAIRYALPGWMNLGIITLKLTTLVAAVGLEDLLRVAGAAGRSTRDYLLFYLVALAIYLLLAAVIGIGQERAERRLHRAGTA